MLIDQPAIEQLAEAHGEYLFRDEAALGTRLNLLLVADGYPSAQRAALAARAEIDRLEHIFNSRNAESELVALNRAPVHRASADLFAVIAAAERWREQTQGACSARLGRILRIWQEVSDELPDRIQLQQLTQEAHKAHVDLEPESLTIHRPAAVEFAVDAIAKGYIVDRAVDAALAMPGVHGAMLDIGGDIRCAGASPHSGWQVALPDPLLPYDNAPVVATAQLHHHAIATSGRGPRDLRVCAERFSPTVSPMDGWPVTNVSASVIARCAMEADALATAMLVLPPERALELATTLDVSLRLTDVAGRVHEAASTNMPRFVRVQSDRDVAEHPGSFFADGWQALATFTAPRRQLVRDPDFRTPYVAMWITDPQNQPVRTLLLVGRRPEWQKDNFIWWSINRNDTDSLVPMRSIATAASGVYNVFWDGRDDDGRFVQPGTYVLHVETSRERGKHTYRSLTLELKQPRHFVQELPPTEEGGGLRVSFDRY